MTQHEGMTCPVCNAVHPLAAKFCAECGAALPRCCAACGSEVPPGANLCPECGTRLGDAPGAVAPAGVAGERAERPARGGDEPRAGERRQLTVMFADLVGSVALAERMDPEDWREMVAEYDAAAECVVERFGGHVVKYLGDGLLASFGYPHAHEDDPERAVRAGLALVECVRHLRVKLAAEPDRAANSNKEEADGPLCLRVGIHTALTVIADAGGFSDLFGNAPNVAARVQAMVEPNEVLITEATHHLVEGRFVVEERGRQMLKGVREPIALYRVLRLSGVRNRREIARPRAPFVGRQDELATLLDAWEAARQGNGRTVLVTSEAGLGKSRLVQHLRQQLSLAPHRWLECHCTLYTQGTAFHPVLDLVAQGLEIEEDDSSAERLRKLTRGLERARMTNVDTLPLLAEFLSLPASAGYEPASMSSAFKRNSILEALVAWHLRLCETRPLLLVIEDLHWCDPSSLELLGRLMKENAAHAMLLICTGRTEFENPWPGPTTVRLERFTADQVREMVAGLPVAGVLPQTTVDAIVARADGVPLYVEELTRAVVESTVGMAGREVGHEIPATLQDSLMARLDRLSSARDVALRAAVLGREFSYGLVAASVGLDEAALRDGLARLVASGILFQRGEPPEATYLFKHALIQEAAYASLLRRTRQELHGRVVEALLACFPERVANAPELVARHAEAAGQVGTAVAYYRRAGEHAQERSAHQEAVVHLRQAIVLLGPPGDAERDRLELLLQLALGASLTAVRGYAHPDRLAVYERARALGEALGDSARLGRALIGVSIYQSTHGEVEPARQLAARVLAMAEQDGDIELAVHGYCQVAVPEHFQGKFVSALAHAEQGLALYDPLTHHRATFEIGGDTGVAALGVASWSLWYLGYPDRARARARETVELANRFPDPFGLGFAACIEATLDWMCGDFEAQVHAAARQIAIGQTYGFPYWLGVGKALHGVARVALGDATALDEVMEGLAIADDTGARAGASLLMAMLADTQGAVGAIEQAKAAIELAFAVSAETGMVVSDAELQRMKGEITLVEGPSSENRTIAEECFRKGIEIAVSQSARSLELRCATSLAGLLRSEGRRSEAYGVLARSYEWFTEGFDTADLCRARSLLDELGGPAHEAVHWR